MYFSDINGNRKITPPPNPPLPPHTKSIIKRCSECFCLVICFIVYLLPASAGGFRITKKTNATSTRRCPPPPPPTLHAKSMIKTYSRYLFSSKSKSKSKYLLVLFFLLSPAWAGFDEQIPRSRQEYNQKMFGAKINPSKSKSKSESKHLLVPGIFYLLLSSVSGFRFTKDPARRPPLSRQKYNQKMFTVKKFF